MTRTNGSSNALASRPHGEALRTPLNATAGYADLLELGIRGPVPPEQRADFGRIQKCQWHLAGLINGGLNYSRLDAGAVAHAIDDVSLDGVLATCAALVAPHCWNL